MQKRDCIVIGDSLAAIHLALKLSLGDISVLLIRPDTSPVEIHETDFGNFDCDLASGCDLSYYFTGDEEDDLYGYRDQFKMLRYPYRMHTPDDFVNEPGSDTDFLRWISKEFPDQYKPLMRFYKKVSDIHDIVDEIETKTGLIPPYPKNNALKIFSQIHPWTSNTVYKLANTSFADFLLDLQIPDELIQLYDFICFDHTGFMPESLDTLTGVELITRRRHGLSYPIGGWASFKAALLNRLRSRAGIEILGGKKIDQIKTSAGIVYEIYVDERDFYTTDWLIIDETIGLIEHDGHIKSEGLFKPSGFYSKSHVDFKFFIGWNSLPSGDIPEGVNFVCADSRFPPQAPHMVRVDIMPPDENDPYGLKYKLTVRGKYPVERIISSKGLRVNKSELQNELIGAIKNLIPYPDSDPVFTEFIMPGKFNNPYVSETAKPKLISPSRFAVSHNNAMMIPSSGISGGSVRLAFRGAERIARLIRHRIKVRQFIYDLAIKPVKINPRFDEIVSGGS